MSLIVANFFSATISSILAFRSDNFLGKKVKVLQNVKAKKLFCRKSPFSRSITFHLSQTLFHLSKTPSQKRPLYKRIPSKWASTAWDRIAQENTDPKLSRNQANAFFCERRLLINFFNAIGLVMAKLSRPNYSRQQSLQLLPSEVTVFSGKVSHCSRTRNMKNSYVKLPSRDHISPHPIQLHHWDSVVER